MLSKKKYVTIRRDNKIKALNFLFCSFDKILLFITILALHWIYLQTLWQLHLIHVAYILQLGKYLKTIQVQIWYESYSVCFWFTVNPIIYMKDLSG